MLSHHLRSILCHWHHDHEHQAHGGAAEAPEHALKQHAGAGQVLYLDAQSGIAGDMFIAALLDLGVPLALIEETVAKLGLPGVRLELQHTETSAIRAVRFSVRVEAPQPERNYAEIRQLLDVAALPTGVQNKAQQVFLRLAQAEGEVHGVPVEQVHFHEVGAVDSIVDIVGAAACLEYLGALLVCSPLPLGHGSVTCRHGIIPLPAPATLLCLRGIETYDAGIAGELVTPTGAAIVGALASECRRWPPLRPLATGWGAGTLTFPDRPNVLRAVLGEPSELGNSAERPIRDVDTHEIFECNVDDMTGEQLGHTIEQLLTAGALDAWAAPLHMKKGRPGWMLCTLSSIGNSDPVARIMLQESTSIGLRRRGVSRIELPRRLVTVETKFGPVPVKVSGSAEEHTLHVKPEFSVCQVFAERHNVPLREVVAAALAAFHGLHSGK